MNRTLFSNYLVLCKPRVVCLMLLTAMVGMCLAAPGAVDWRIFVLGNLGIGFVAAAAAVINHCVDIHIDRIMKRTRARPIAQGTIKTSNALVFSAFLMLAGLNILYWLINPLSAVLTFFSMVGYAFIYTLWLKHATPQNIVIGGAAGAAPPLLGWVCVTGQVDAPALLLMLIIFVWTPPHFWALAIHRLDDYKNAKVPMLPVIYGVPVTKRAILIYSLLLAAVTLLPILIGLTGVVYCALIGFLNAYFLYFVLRLFADRGCVWALRTFRASIIYLMVLFVVLLLDHYCFFPL